MASEEDSGFLAAGAEQASKSNVVNAARIRWLVQTYLRPTAVGRGGRLTGYALVPSQLRWVRELALAAGMVDVYWRAVQAAASARVTPLPIGATRATGHSGWWRERCALVRQAFPDPSAWLWNTGGLLQAVAGDDRAGLVRLVARLPEHEVFERPRWMRAQGDILISCRLGALFRHPDEPLPGLFLAEVSEQLIQSLRTYTSERAAVDATQQTR